MKKIPLILLLFGLTISGFAKTEKEIAVFSGQSAGRVSFSVLRSGILRGIAPSYLRQNLPIGINFKSDLNNKQNLKIEGGINYLTGIIEHGSTLPFNPDYNEPITEKYNLVSAPIYLNHYFGKYFFINEGIMLEYQQSPTEKYTGFGAGIGFGIGVKYDYDYFRFYLKGKYEKHLFLSEKFGLMEYGILLGVGYKF